MFNKNIKTLISISVILLIPALCYAGRGGGGGGMGGMGGMGGGGRTGGIAGGFAGGTTSTGGTTIVGTDQSSISLIPWPEKKWIIVRAPAEYMQEIEELINQFDIETDPGENNYSTYNVRYVDVDELASTLTSILAESDVDFQRNVSIQPLPTSRQLLVFGKQEYRDLVYKILEEIDRPSDQLVRKSFVLEYADPEDIKEKIDELFSLTSSTGTTNARTTTSRTSYGNTGSGMSSLSADTVITTIYPSLRQIVVLASEEKMLEVEKQIKAWDSPIEWDNLKPRIITVNNIDPVDLVTLLNSLFSTSSTTSTGSSSTSQRQLLSATGSSSEASLGEKIIGPLYGKLTFIAIPDTKKIIVASSIADAYEAIENFIEEIDEQDPAIIPKVVLLKYADPEDLSKRLNAVFAEAGTSVNIDMSVQGLSSESYIDSTQSSDSTTAEEYQPPWASSGGTADEGMPISNIFGKVRFMPEPNTKSILLLAPQQFMEKLEELITDLDVTGKQVMIETIIMEVEHNTLTSLGFEFSSDGTALSSIGRFGVSTDAVIGNPIDFLDYTSGLQKSDDFFLSGFGLTMLVDFLKKNGNARILNQQTLWTKDNEEANFFKGKQIPFVTGTTTTNSGSGGTTSSDTYEFQLVGTEVRVRPRITPENNVGMVINVNYSQQTGDKGLGNMDILSQMNTKTNMVIKNGDTLILGGILFQKDSTVSYKIPGLGDIPVLGSLFTHDSINKENTELLVFIKPQVIDVAPEDIYKVLDVKTREFIEESKARLEQVKKEINSSMKEVLKKEK
ncbi:MAG: hypothetical protein JXA96_03225 [Sedimentisphaerales bacterium]|nr:hypothetical protein [Sedimentisphaerales bacterium]